jgi:GNAT superfamily N-acetyltransferase
MLQVRRYQEVDKEAVWELHNLALAPTGAHFGNGPWDEDLRDIQSHYLDNLGEFLVGVLENQIVCMGAFRRRSASMAEIKRMRVHPKYQRKGYGQLILSKLEEKASQTGYTELCLDTTAKQVPAQKLYEKNGYQEIGRGFIASFEVIFYEKKLTFR